MIRQRLTTAGAVLFMAAACAATVIPSRMDGWRVEVGPAGNDFYDRSAPERIGKDDVGGTNDKPPSSEKKFAALAEASLGQYRAKYNFTGQIKKLGVLPKNSDGSFRFVVMGDSRSDWDAFSTIIRHIDSLRPRPAFIINTGDIVPHGYLSEYRDYYVKAMEQTDIPCFAAMGNHDDSSDGKAREWRYLFGDSSLNYYFDYGRCRFIFIDNCSKAGDEGETLKWLSATLRRTPAGCKKYVVAHKPPKVIEKWAYHAWGTDESKVFVRLMELNLVGEVFLGHIHAYSTADFNGVRYTVSGGGGAPQLHGRFGTQGSVRHYVICDVAGSGKMTQHVVRFYKDE